jgi:hypothetical protein
LLGAGKKNSGLPFTFVEHDVGEICIGESIGQLIIANTDNLT